jgi:diguanylate cyclase (GGDEF)-like protein
VAALCGLALARSRAHPQEAITAREAVIPREAVHRSGEAARPRVLLVAAPGRRRRALVTLLEPGHEVALARDAATAARLARTGAVDAALVDLADGRAALTALARLRAAGVPDLGAVVVGLPGDAATRLRALELGAELSTSPWTGPELLARLDRAIRLGRATRALRDQALTDPLTGLANRRALRARLAEELQRVRRYRTTLTCLMADIDQLKAINDDLGHAAGDQALQGAAAALRAGLRETDFAARAGGDEFLVLLPHTSERQGAVLAERLRRRLRQVRVGPPGASRRLEASIGVAQLGARADGEAMVEAADRALYAAKQAGRATVRRATSR